MLKRCTARCSAGTAFGLVVLLGVFLFAGGCSVVPGWAGGEPAPTKLVADGDQSFEETVDLDEPLILDMRDPGLSGYAFAGVVFDPAMFRLDSVLEDDLRARYVFTPLTVGEGVVEVRIRAKSGGPLETYKRVKVTVED